MEAGATSANPPARGCASLSRRHRDHRTIGCWCWTTRRKDIRLMQLGDIGQGPAALGSGILALEIGNGAPIREHHSLGTFAHPGRVSDLGSGEEVRSRTAAGP